MFGSRKTSPPSAEKLATAADKVRDEVEKARAAEQAAHAPHASAAQSASTPPAGAANNVTPNGGANGGAAASLFSKPTPAGAAKKLSEVLGEIVWLMSQSPLHKQFFISDLEWFVMTPALLQQFRMFYADNKPIGVVLWGSVSEEVEERLKAGTSKLRPHDWKSGDRHWVVEVIAPFGKAEEMVADLKAKVFPGKELKYLAVTVEGKKVRVA